MHPLSDSAASNPGGAVKPAGSPGPRVVPPRTPKKRKTAFFWAFAVAAVGAIAGVYYLNSRSASKTAAGGGLITVPSIAVSLGDLNATIRVNGTVAAQSFASLTAPRILGSRSALNRGGDSNFGGGPG